MIREDEVVVRDVTEQFLNESGEGDESLNRGDGSGEVELDGSGGTLNIGNSDEVHIY